MNIIMIILGTLFLALGMIGVILPILPTTPFLILAAFFYAKSSQKLHNKLVNSNLYKKYINDLVVSKEMPFKRKIEVQLVLTLFLFLAFIVMSNLHGRIVISVVWMLHIYFINFKVKTKNERTVDDDK